MTAEIAFGIEIAIAVAIAIGFPRADKADCDSGPAADSDGGV